MAKILEQGNVTKCDHCTTTFSFGLSEVVLGTKRIPAGYSPEEEAYERVTYSVRCPSCGHAVNVGKNLGEGFKRDAERRISDRRGYEDDTYI